MFDEHKTIDELNEAFGTGENILFQEGSGGLTKAVINNRAGRAEVYLFGGLVTHFAESGRYPLLWTSRDAIYDGKKAIRGGIPICWPWFGDHEHDTSLPAHGFARTRHWDVQAAHHDSANEKTDLVLSLKSDDLTRQMFPHDFHLELSVRVSHSLTLELTIHNTGDNAFVCATALHTYLAVANIDDIRIAGLENVQYIDKLDQQSIKREQDPLSIDCEVDRMYFDIENDVTVQTPERTITVAKSGSQSTVVWNPWIEKSKRMSDFPNNGFREMLCVETANVANDTRTIAPGQSHLITQTISAH